MDALFVRVFAPGCLGGRFGQRRLGWARPWAVTEITGRVSTTVSNLLGISINITANKKLYHAIIERVVKMLDLKLSKSLTRAIGGSRGDFQKHRVGVRA